MVVFLKRAKELQPKKTAKFYLHQMLSHYEAGRSTEVIHASELTKSTEFCPREYALYDLTKKKRPDQWLTTSESMTYQIGRDQERNIVKWFGQMGRAYCDWQCVACAKIHEAQPMPATGCSACGCPDFEPKEMRFKSAVSGASCGVDMILDLGGDKLVPHEIKTMDKEEFKALQMPLAEHKHRTNLYLRIIAESKHPLAKKIDTKTAVVLYVSKGGYGCADTSMQAFGMTDRFSPFKEYEVKRDDKLTVSEALRAKVVTDYRAGKTGVPHGVCATAMTKRACSCAMKTVCFSGQFPPEHDWKPE